MIGYTLTLYELMRDELFEVFDFEYDFYTDEVRRIEEFEKKFVNSYYFNMINNPVVHVWKWQLKSKLDRIMPYYKQLYETELRSKELDFLLNKDYREEFIREIDKGLVERATGTENKNISDTISTSNENTSNSNKHTTDEGEINTKGSDINNGNGSVGLKEGYLTSVGQDRENRMGTEDINITNNSNEKKTGKIEGRISNEANKNTDEKLTEKTTLVGKGNIGVTSSAELLQKWREVLINIDNMILEECRDLFLLVY